MIFMNILLLYSIFSYSYCLSCKKELQHVYFLLETIYDDEKCFNGKDLSTIYDKEACKLNRQNTCYTYVKIKANSFVVENHDKINVNTVR